MNIFRDRTKSHISDFLIFVKHRDGKVTTGVNFGAPLMLVHQAGPYRVYHHKGGTGWVSYFSGHVYSAAAFMLVRVQPSRIKSRKGIETATILLAVEPAHQWRACKRQMIRACNLLHAIDGGKNDSQRITDPSQCARSDAQVL